MVTLMNQSPHAFDRFQNKQSCLTCLIESHNKGDAQLQERNTSLDRTQQQAKDTSGVD